MSVLRLGLPCLKGVVIYHGQTKEDLQGDALLHYDAEIKAMNLILLSIPNDIYNSVDACTTAKAMWKRVELDTFDDLFYYLQQFEKLVNVSRAKKLEKSHDPLGSRLFEPRLQETLQLFNATTAVENDIMLGIVQSQEFMTQNTSWNKFLLANQDEAGVILYDGQN
ncbi:hypothetical protein Tco_0842671 [Tanacetum coccineum]|uniref:Uncharacterized protein n=1 Tax=Tanacetum coccineum TaxID=301880 RepID=A0ABQ5B1N1_9ASTR